MRCLFFSTFPEVTGNVSYDYDSDPHRVTKILLEAAQNHPNVLSEPAPAFNLVILAIAA
jgi:small-conductance mechanosensitive channel